MKTIKSNLIISYFIMSASIILLLTLLFNRSLNLIFEQYAKNRQIRSISQIKEQIREQYIEKTGSYNISAVEIIGNAALQNKIMIHVQTVSDELDWDIKTHKEQECRLLIQHADYNMHSRYPEFTGGYEEMKYDLTWKGDTVGYLTVGYYGPYSLDQEDLSLMKQLNEAILLLSPVVVLITVVLGLIVARRITGPISGTVEITKKIAEGEYGVQIMQNSRIIETNELLQSINTMSAALQEEQEKKKRITADIAHELRTPLSNLQSHLEAMIDGIWEPNSERLESCHEEILRLTNIVEQLRELFMIENEKDSLAFEQIDFYQMCKALAYEFEPKLKAKKIDLFLRTEQGDILWGDTHRIKQCMINLISNAIQYSEKNSTVTVEYRQEREQSVVRIKNTGKGIPKADLSYLFERFYRVDKSRNSATGGMGIGLPITKAIVESHGGSIHVESHENIETVFEIRLPSAESL